KGLQEEATLIAVDLWLHEQDAGYFGRVEHHPLALLFGDCLEVDAVLVVLHGLRLAQEVVARQPAEAESDLLRASHLESLPLLDRLDEIPRLKQRFVRSRIEPCDATAESLDKEIPGPEVGSIHVGDLKFATRGRTQRGGDIEDPIVIKIEAGDRPMGAGHLRLLFDPERTAFL